MLELISKIKKKLILLVTFCALLDTGCLWSTRMKRRKRRRVSREQGEMGRRRTNSLRRTSSV